MPGCRLTSCMCMTRNRGARGGRRRTIGLPGASSGAAAAAADGSGAEESEPEPLPGEEGPLKWKAVNGAIVELDHYQVSIGPLP